MNHVRPSRTLPPGVTSESTYASRVRIHQIVAAMTEKGIPVVRVDSTLKAKEFGDAIERIAAGGPLLVLTTPETFVKQPRG